MTNPLLLEALLRKQSQPRSRQEVAERHREFADVIDPLRVRSLFSKFLKQMHDDISYLLGLDK